MRTKQNMRALPSPAEQTEQTQTHETFLVGRWWVAEYSRPDLESLFEGHENFPSPNLFISPWQSEINRRFLSKSFTLNHLMFSCGLAKNKKSALFNIHLFITRVVNYHQTVEEKGRRRDKNRKEIR